DRTYFKRVSGGPFYPGMLLVQKGGKGFTSSKKTKEKRNNASLIGMVGSGTAASTGNSSSLVSNASPTNYSDDDDLSAWFIRAGINSTNYLVDDEGSGLNNRMGFFAELGYEVRANNFGGAFSLMYSGEGGEALAGTSNGEVNYLNMVILPKLYIADVIFLQAGLEVGFKVGAVDEYVDELISGVDMKIPLGIGIQLGKFSLDFRYRPGLLDINSLATDSDAVIKNTGIQIGAALKF